MVLYHLKGAFYLRFEQEWPVKFVKAIYFFSFTAHLHAANH